MAEQYEFLKGHGTENDFVLLPDHDGSVHGGLSEDAWASRVAALCDRRAGIGGDGVLRVVRTAAFAEAGADVAGTEWFMDYRNADGSIAEMCGNGVRVFVLHLVQEGLVDAATPVTIGTRDGTRVVRVEGGLMTADMGEPRVLDDTTVTVGERRWPARHVDMGNPHAVVLVDDLGEAGALLVAPAVDPTTYPHGVNVEFVVRRGAQHVAMRVHERGSGETRSCGTGACAVMVAAALADGLVPAVTDVVYRVDVLGGTLTVTWTVEGRVLLTGPAALVARGRTDLGGGERRL